MSIQHAKPYIKLCSPVISFSNKTGHSQLLVFKFASLIGIRFDKVLQQIKTINCSVFINPYAHNSMLCSWSTMLITPTLCYAIISGFHKMHKTLEWTFLFRYSRGSVYSVSGKIIF